ncbi:MAG: radical SAM family heme chaperone HemW [Pseudomonadota bacterium]|nr:radical SAM family heme chaperone HemW [Pseudomonadota bacterium]
MQARVDHQPIEHLYLHVPFCSALCHYCDFAKTANFTTALTSSYFKRLVEHLELWCAAFPISLRTLYIGGGTPSLFNHAYRQIFASIAPYLRADCEITLEANPQDISKANLLHWQELGVNRLSIGVQTFAPASLRFLQRQHSAKQSFTALESVAEHFAGSCSVDLIYGMQSVVEWQRDLHNVCRFPLQHISCYSLTYEPRTPLGRAAARGKIDVGSDAFVADMYCQAVETLASTGYEHYEISNWGKRRSQHNLCYWQDKSYIGVGSGAHGYLADPVSIGQRYAYTTSERKFIRLVIDSALPLKLKAISIDQRDASGWLLEYLATGLRCVEGVNLDRIATKARRHWQPTETVRKAINAKQLLISRNKRLHLASSEWLREQRWVMEVLRCFV